MNAHSRAVCLGLLTAAWLASGCSSSTSTDAGPGPVDSGPTTDAGPGDAGPADAGPADAGPADAGSASACGQPGDTGNELGVGQYCTAQGTCPGTAPVCSTINNVDGGPQTFFCVLPCSACSPPDYCGTGASCVCSTAGCGCVPDTCHALFAYDGNPPCPDGG